MYPPDTYSKDTYPPITYPLDTYPPGHIQPGHLPPGHLPPGHLPPRTYTPQSLKCPILFMHYVLITYCTLKSIYFARIDFICDAGAKELSDICSVRKGKIPTTTQALDSQEWGRVLGILISILLACTCHSKF